MNNVFGPSHWKCITGAKKGAKWDGILTPNKSFLFFRAPKLCERLYQNRIKIVIVGARIDRQTEDRRTQVILSSVPCYAIAVRQIIKHDCS